MMKFKTQNKILKGLLVLIGVVGVGLVVHASGSVQKVQNYFENANVTIYNAADSAEQQNGESVGAPAVASAATRLSLSPLPTAIGGDSGVYMKGGFEADGASYVDNTLSVSGTTTLGRSIFGGNVSNKTGVATSTLAATDLCMNSILTITPVSTTPTITLPSTSTLFASSGGCLTADGQYFDVLVRSITTSSILAAGTGSTLREMLFTSSSVQTLQPTSITLSTSTDYLARFYRDSSISYRVEIAPHQ